MPLLLDQISHMRDHGARVKPGNSAFKIPEFLIADVGTETALGYVIIAQFCGDEIRYRVSSVSSR